MSSILISNYFLFDILIYCERHKELERYQPLHDLRPSDSAYDLSAKTNDSHNFFSFLDPRIDTACVRQA